MLLAALVRVITEMRLSYEAFRSVAGRTATQVLEVGFTRLRVLFPQYANDVENNGAGARDILNLSAKAIVAGTTFAAARVAAGRGPDLPPSILGLIENTLAAPLP